jgi:hypothetical protein
MLFPKAILEAEWAADAPFREAMAIKRERLRALRTKWAAERAAKQRSTQSRPDGDFDLAVGG